MLETLIHPILSLFLAISPYQNLSSRYDQVLTTLQKIQTQYPHTAEVIVIGLNDKGVPIKGLKIGSGPVGSLIVATHHGNEYGSTAVGLGVAEDLAKQPIANQTVYVIPVLNITGYNSNNRYESGTRGSYDPNRDYPGPCVKGSSFNLKSTKLLADFLVEKKIQISATLHTFYPSVVYPWGISTRDLTTPYEQQYRKLVADATKESGYKTGNNTEVMYAADGTFEDYAYWKHGIWSLLFELGFSHSPGQTEVENTVRYNIPGIRRFLENSPQQAVADHGFSGRCDPYMMKRMVLE